MDGYVLAGGAGSRMGFDKARARWGDVPLAVATLLALQAVCGRVFLVRRGPPDGLPWCHRDGSAVQVLREPAVAQRHPLWGVATALAHAGGPHAVVVPCDVPELSAASLERLIAARGVAETDGRRQPLVAVFPTAWAERARQAATAGTSVHRFGNALPGVALPPSELRNVNRIEQLPDHGAFAQLVEGSPVSGDAARARLALGEARRLAHRGILDPEAPARLSSWTSREDR